MPIFLLTLSTANSGWTDLLYILSRLLLPAFKLINKLVEWYPVHWLYPIRPSLLTKTFGSLAYKNPWNSDVSSNWIILRVDHGSSFWLALDKSSLSLGLSNSTTGIASSSNLMNQESSLGITVHILKLCFANKLLTWEIEPVIGVLEIAIPSQNVCPCLRGSKDNSSFYSSSNYPQILSIID